MRKCKQCLQLLPLDNFRQYCRYDKNGSRTDSRYLQCLNCERINNSYKHAKRTDNKDAIIKLEEILNAQAVQGGIIPGLARQSVDEAIAIAKERLSNASNDMTAWNLQNWLTENFTSDDIDVVEGIFLEFLDANYPKYKRSVEDSSMISTIFNRISDECN